MEKKRISDERLAELIRAAALRREVPVGLETRVMAQVILRDRRRRERRAQLYAKLLMHRCLDYPDI